MDKIQLKGCGMDALQLLEQKISSLVTMVKELRTENGQLRKSIEAISKDYADLRAENAKLAEDNAQMTAKLEGLEKEALKGSDQIDELNQERALTKMAVDDLLERLKVIDSLVEHQ